MFLRTLVIGVSLVALLGGEGECRRDDAMRNSTPLEALSASVRAKQQVIAAERQVASRMRHMAIEQAKLGKARAIKGGSKKRRQRRIDVHYSAVTGLKEQLSQAHKDLKRAEKTYRRTALTHRQFAGLLPDELWLDGVLPHMGWGEVKALMNAVPSLRGVSRDLVGVPSFEAALATLACHVSDEDHAFAMATRLLDWFAPDASVDAGFVGAAYWARLLREAVTASADDDGNISMVPELKTQLNKALKSGEKHAIARSLMIWRHQADFFTADMEGAVHSQIIAALAQKTADEIEAFASAWTKHQSDFVTEDMNGDERAKIIIALAPLTPEQIAAIAKNSSQLFTSDMGGFGRAEIIEAFAPLTPDKIAAFADAWTTHKGAFLIEYMDGGERFRNINDLAKLISDYLADEVVRHHGIFCLHV